MPANPATSGAHDALRLASALRSEAPEIQKVERPVTVKLPSTGGFGNGSRGWPHNK